jgi:capsular polysaccharide transport system permease protein
MPENLQADPVIQEIRLEPVASKGELVTGDWWQPTEPDRMPWARRHWLFLLLVGLPVTLAALYLGVIASDQFVCEAQFIVRSSDHSDTGNLASLMQNEKLSRAVDETYAVNDYIVSRDVVDLLVREHNLRAILSRPQADIFNRFPNFYSRDNNERLLRHFRRMVDTDIDSESGISTIDVRAFTPEDARDIAVALLRSGEALVNRLNARAHEDALRNAKQDVEDAKARLLDVEARLTKFRNDQNVVDPNKEASAALGALVGMMTDLAQTEAALNQLIATAPHSPAISTMRERLISTEQEIAKQRAEIVGTSKSMAAKMAEFDKLMLDRDIAGKTLGSAIAQFESARHDAQQQQLYLETIVEPNLADESLYPKRILWFFIVLGVSLCIYWIVSAFVTSVSEHQG